MSTVRNEYLQNILRWDELSGLRWSDIQEKKFTLSQTIRRNHNFDEKDSRRTSLQISTTKTKAGRRTISLTSTLSEILGHSNITLTLQLYTHSTSETKRNAMRQLEIFP